MSEIGGQTECMRLYYHRLHPPSDAARLRHPRAIKRRPAEYGLEVDGIRQDGDDGHLLQRRRRGTAKHRRENVGMMIDNLWQAK